MTILKEQRYGDFTTHAQITQDLKDTMRDTPNYPTLPPHMKEALDMIAHKIGRILNGDPNYDDSWIDIIGYTQLVLDTLTPPSPPVDWAKCTHIRAGEACGITKATCLRPATPADCHSYMPSVDTSIPDVRWEQSAPIPDRCKHEIPIGSCSNPELSRASCPHTIPNQEDCAGYTS